MRHPLDISHDSGDERAGFVFVEEGNWQLNDLFLHLRAKRRNQVLCFHAEKPGQKKRGHGLDENGQSDDHQQDPEQGCVVLDDDIVDEIFAGAGQNQPR